MKTKTITINLGNLEKITAEADKIFLSPAAEKEIIKVIELQKQVDDALETMKKAVEAAGLALNPNFTSIQADRLKAYYRAYGSKYLLDESQINLVPKELYTVESKVTYKIDSDAVEKWAESHKGMPAGINEVPVEKRPKKLTFALKK